MITDALSPVEDWKHKALPASHLPPPKATGVPHPPGGREAATTGKNLLPRSQLGTNPSSIADCLITPVPQFPHLQNHGLSLPGPAGQRLHSPGSQVQGHLRAQNIKTLHFR